MFRPCQPQVQVDLRRGPVQALAAAQPQLLGAESQLRGDPFDGDRRLDPGGHDGLHPFQQRIGGDRHALTAARLANPSLCQRLCRSCRQRGVLHARDPGQQGIHRRQSARRGQPLPVEGKGRPAECDALDDVRQVVAGAVGQDRLAAIEEPQTGQDRATRVQPPQGRPGGFRPH